MRDSVVLRSPEKPFKRMCMCGGEGKEGSSEGRKTRQEQVVVENRLRDEINSRSTGRRRGQLVLWGSCCFRC